MDNKSADGAEERGVPTFSTERLILRRPTLADAASYQRHFADYEVIRHLASHISWPYPPDGARQFLCNVILPNQGNDRWAWGIFLKENPAEIIGLVDLWRDGRPEHRGFWLSRQHWGKGYMTEAVEPVMDHAFGPLGFEELIFANAFGNQRSGRIKEKTGASFLRREPAEYVDPAYTEQEIWRLTKQDWLTHRMRVD